MVGSWTLSMGRSNQPSCRVAAGAADLNFSSGYASRIEGLAYPLHAARLGFLPESVRGIAPAIVTPSDGRRILRIRLRQASPNNSPQDGADSLPSVRFIALVRHAQQHEVSRVREVVSGVQAYGN